MAVNFTEIARRRERMGLTLEQAARAAGHKGARARSWWHDIESGKKRDPRISTLEKLSRVLRCRVDQLLTK